jgi:hypothetical protein
VAEQERGRPAVLQTGTGHQHGDQQAQSIHQQMPLAPVDCLAAVIATLGPSPLGGLDRWALDARRARGRLTPNGSTYGLPPWIRSSKALLCQRAWVPQRLPQAV